MLRGQLNGIEDTRRNLKSLNPKPYQKYGRLKVTNGADVIRKDYEWIWPQMLAKGELHIFSGEGGVGKTQVMLNLAATITTGGRFPNMGAPCEAGTVLYISSEDDAEKTLMPRFDACGGYDESIGILYLPLIAWYMVKSF